MAKPLGYLRMRLWMWVFLALACGLALRLYFVLAAPRISGDTLVYGDVAKNLIEHHVYGFSVQGAAPRPTLIRLPGYPLFLALCFELFGLENYQAVLYVQTALDLASSLLAAALARRLFGIRSGLLALWLAVLCPFTANYAAAALTETLTLFCIAVTFYAVQRWSDAGQGFNRWLWVIAAALAFAVLLRPEQGLLAAAVVPAMLWMAWPSHAESSRSRVRAIFPVAAAALCVALPLLPWTLRNQRTFHVFQPLAPRYANDPGERVPFAFQRWYRTWAIDFASTENCYWPYDGEDINVDDLPTRAFDSDSQYLRTAELLGRYDLTDTATPRLDQSFNALAEERIASNPLRYHVALPAARLLNMLFRPRTEMMNVPLEWWKWRLYRSKTLFAALYAALNLGYFLLAGTGLLRCLRTCSSSERALSWSMTGYIVLRCALLLTIDNSEPRYTLEFFPILFVWASVLFRGRPNADRSASSCPS